MCRFSLIPLATVTALLLASCGKELRSDIPGEDTPLPIAFSAAVDGITKAPGEIPSVEKLHSAGFGVFGCYTGLNRYSESSVSSDFMHNQQIIWTAGDAWDYDPVKYWPSGEGEPGAGLLGHHVSFFAYAPFSDGDSSFPAVNPAGYCIPSFCNPVEKGDPWLLYRLHPDVDRQVDLMWAEPLLDRSKPQTADRLTFTFRHALSCVGDNVTVACTSAFIGALQAAYGSSYDTVQVILQYVGIECTLLEKARLVLWNRGEPNWQAVTSEGGSVLRSRTFFSGEQELWRYEAAGHVSQRSNWQGNGMGIFYIPLSTAGVVQSATVTVRYVIRRTRDGVSEEEGRSVSSTFTLDGDSADGVKRGIRISLQNND